jgi:hypothetical protein
MLAGTKSGRRYGHDDFVIPDPMAFRELELKARNQPLKMPEQKKSEKDPFKITKKIIILFSLVRTVINNGNFGRRKFPNFPQYLSFKFHPNIP